MLSFHCPNRIPLIGLDYIFDSPHIADFEQFITFGSCPLLLLQIIPQVKILYFVFSIANYSGAKFQLSICNSESIWIFVQPSWNYCIHNCCLHCWETSNWNVLHIFSLIAVNVIDEIVSTRCIRKYKKSILYLLGL